MKSKEEKNGGLELPKELNEFLNKVERIKRELDRIENKNEELETHYEEVISLFTGKDNQQQFERLFFSIFLFSGFEVKV